MPRQKSRHLSTAEANFKCCVWCSAWLYRFIFCLISFWIRSAMSVFISSNKMFLIFWYLTFFNVLSKTSKVSENSVASGSVSLDMEQSIWSGKITNQVIVETHIFFNYWSIRYCYHSGLGISYICAIVN